MALPGFEGRLGRLGFLGRSIAWSAMTGVAAIVLSILAALGGRASSGMSLLAVGALVLPISLYAGLSLQTRRLNDIGWPALPVIGMWFLLNILDVVLAHVVPTLARSGGGTMLGAFVNAAFMVVLLLCPGGDGASPDLSGRSEGAGSAAPPPKGAASGFGHRAGGFDPRSA